MSKDGNGRRSERGQSSKRARLTISSASAVRVPQTSRWSMLVAACRLLSDELSDGSAVMDDALLVREGALPDVAA